jgi:hypothetical protein
MDPTDVELANVLRTLRGGLHNSAADKLTVAIEHLTEQERGGLIDERQRLEAAVVCALILRVRTHQ